MGYSHIGIEERRRIARLRKAGTTVRQIAASLDRSPSAISREINRNRLSTGEYKPVQADERAQARRWRGPRLDRDDLLRDAVFHRLAWGASPEQAAGNRHSRESGNDEAPGERGDGAAPVCGARFPPTRE